MTGQKKPAGGLPISLSLYEIVCKLFERGNNEGFLETEIPVLEWLLERALRSDLKASYSKSSITTMNGYMKYGAFSDKEKDEIERASTVIINRKDWRGYLESLRQGIAENKKWPPYEPWDVVLLRHSWYGAKGVEAIKASTGKERKARLADAKEAAESLKQSEAHWTRMAEKIIGLYKENPFWDDVTPGRKVSAPHVTTVRAALNSAQREYIALFKQILKTNPRAKALQANDPRVKQIMKNAKVPGGRILAAKTFANWANAVRKSLAASNSPS